jgi:DNA modification methylase
VIDEDNVILAGNGVTEAAAEAGITRVRVIEASGDELIAVRRSGLTGAQKRSLAIYDNRTAELAEWSPEQIRADIDAGLDLKPWFTEDELAAVVGVVEKSGLTDPDAVPQERPTAIQRGDLFQLGVHRLLCGDSTSSADVVRLLGGDRIDLCFTSPPYGAGNTAKLRDHYVPGADQRESFYVSHRDDPSEWLSLMGRWMAAVRPSVHAVVCNVQMLADNKRLMVEWLYAFRDDLCDVLIWDKGHGAPQMQARVLTNVFEFLFVLGGNGTRAIPFSNFHGTLQNVVRVINRVANETGGEHRATMPIDLPKWVLGEMCSGAASILEPFSGSGTTLIACEQLARRCYAMEIEPAYVQMAIDRWEAFTGQKAVKVEEAALA